MSKPLGTTGLHTFSDKFEGIYRGTVTDNNDPDRQGKVRVRVYPMFADIDAALLPWAIMSCPIWDGAGVGTGWFALPDVGTNVYCMFEQGSPYQPIIIGEAPDAIKGLPTERTTNYPNRKVLKTSGGVIIYIDDSTGEIKLQNAETTITIKGGDVTMTTSGDIVISGASINLNPS